MNVRDIEMKPFSVLDDEWALVTAGTKNQFNSMTISWGSFGMIWYKPVISIYIRKKRYTFEFIEKGDYFTISLYPKEFKDDMKILGSKSGRDCDKLSQTKLKPKYIGDNLITYEGARITYVCKKLHIQEILEGNSTANDNNHMLIMAEVVDIK